MGKGTLINIKETSFHFRDVSPNKDGYREAQNATFIVNGKGCTMQHEKANEIFAIPRSCRQVC
jgi:hypothetical protein